MSSVASLPMPVPPADAASATSGRPAAAPLRGRDDVLDRLTAALHRAGSGAASCLTVTGAAGQGKTRVLEQIGDHARSRGFTVTGTSGREVLSDMVFAGLAGVARPLFHGVDELAPAQARALRGAFGLEHHQASPLAVGNAMLSLLATASDRAPLCVVVDDAHWLDRSSLSILLFVAHQLAAERVAMIFGCRTGELDPSTYAGLPSIELTDLDASAAELLLTDQRAPAAVARACWRLAGGNPLALLEGFRGLTPAQRAGAAGMPPALPMGDHLLDAFGSQLRHLAPQTLRALAVVAVDTTGELGSVGAAVVHAGGALDDLKDAEAAGVIDLLHDHVTWRHPLVRAAVVLRTPPEVIRTAHRSLADTLPAGCPDEHRLWHLADSVIGRDEAVATRLDDAAHAAFHRGAVSTAAGTMRRAAGLSPDDRVAGRRLLQSARFHLGAGELDSVIDQLRPLLARRDDARFTAEVAEVFAQADLWVSGPARAVDLLEHHAALVRPTDPTLSAITFLRSSVASLLRLDTDGAARSTRAAVEAAAESGDLDAAMGAWAIDTVMATFGGGLADTPAQADTVEQILAVALAGLETGRDGVDVLVLLCAYALIVHDRPQTAEPALRRLTRFADGSGWTGLAVMTRVLRTEALWRQGRWSEASAEITLAVAVQSAGGLDALVPLTRAMSARVLAGLGRPVDGADVAAVAGAELGLGPAVAWAHGARGLLHLGAGRHEEAADALGQVAAAMAGVGQPGWFWWQADLVEALHGAGRVEEASHVLTAFSDDAEPTGASWASGAVHRCRALVGDEDPEAGYATALDVFTTIGAPFERARTLVLRGEHRRRTGAGPAGSRDLAEARTIFDRLGARHWSARAATARDEPRRGDAPLALRLTGKELPVALLVGNGATDRVVGEELFISTKTVSYHLGNIYRKLGIGNRTQLGVLVAAERLAADR